MSKKVIWMGTTIRKNADLKTLPFLNIFFSFYWIRYIEIGKEPLKTYYIHRELVSTGAMGTAVPVNFGQWVDRPYNFRA